MCNQAFLHSTYIFTSVRFFSFSVQVSYLGKYVNKDFFTFEGRILLHKWKILISFIFWQHMDTSFHILLFVTYDDDVWHNMQYVMRSCVKCNITWSVICKVSLHVKMCYGVTCVMRCEMLVIAMSFVKCKISGM